MAQKRFAINMISQIVAFVVNFGIGFFLTSYIVNHIGKEAYGFAGLANNFINYAQVVTIALNSMAARYISINIYNKNYEAANKYFTSILYSNILLSIVFFIISIFVVYNLEKIVNISNVSIFDIKLLFFLCFFNFILGIIASVFCIATFTANRLDLSSLQSIISNIAKVVILFVLFAIFSPHVWYLGLTAIILTSYLFIVNISYTKKFLPEIRIKSKYFDIYKIKELLSSGFWNTINKLSSILSAGFDLLIANIFINTAAMGTLSIAKTIPLLILTTFTTIANVFAPNITVLYAKEKNKALKLQILGSMRFLGFITSIPLAILFVYGDMFYKLWIPGEDTMTIYIISIITCFELCFALPQEVLLILFTVTNKVKASSLNLLFVSVLTIVSVLITMYNIKPEYKIYCLGGISSFYGIIRLLTFLPLYGAKCLNYKWNTFYFIILKTFLSIVILTLLSFIIKYLTQDLMIISWKNLIIKVLATSFIGLIINYYLILNKKDRQFNKIIRYLRKCIQ